MSFKNDGDVRLRFTAEDATRGAIDSASRNLGGLGAQAEAARARLDGMGTIIGRISGPGGAMAVMGATAAASAAFIVQQADAISAYMDAADKMGDSAENVAAMQLAMDLSGTSLDTVTSNSIRLTSSLAKMDEESSQVAIALRAIGLDVQAFKALAPAEQYEAVAHALAGFADGSEKTAIAVALFGKSGADLLPMLKDLAETGGLHVRLTQQQIEEADKLSKNMARLRSEAGLLGQEIGAALIPPVNALIDRWRAGQREGESFLEFVIKQAGVLARYGSPAGLAMMGIDKLLGRDPSAVDISAYGKVRDQLEHVDQRLQNINLTEKARNRLLEQQAALRQKMAGYLTGDRMTASTDPRSLGRVIDTSGLGDKPERKTGKSEAEREADREAAILAKLSGVTTTYQEDLARLNRIYSAGRITVEQYREAVVALIEDQPGARALIQAEEKAQKDLNDTREKAAALARRASDALAADNESRVGSNQALREEIEAIGLTAGQLAQLTLARMDATIAAEQENLVRAQGIEGNEEEVAQIERRIELMRQQRELTERKTERTEVAQLAEEAERRTKSIGDSIEQGVLNGFREGQSISDIFLNELKGQFARTVLRPQIDFVAKGLNSLFDQVMGGGGGLLSSVGDLFGSLFSFDGGGNTGNGPRLGGLDGKGGFLAMMHPRETVVDHTRGQRLAPSVAPIQVNTTVHVAADGSAQSQRQGGNDSAGRALSAQLEQSVIAIISRETRQGGVLWKRGQGYA